MWHLNLYEYTFVFESKSYPFSCWSNKWLEFPGSIFSEDWRYEWFCESRVRSWVQLWDAFHLPVMEIRAFRGNVGILSFCQQMWLNIGITHIMQNPKEVKNFIWWVDMAIKPTSAGRSCHLPYLQFSLKFLRRQTDDDWRGWLFLRHRFLDTEEENKLRRLQQEDACRIKVFSSRAPRLETSGLVMFWQEWLFLSNARQTK